MLLQKGVRETGLQKKANYKKDNSRKAFRKKLYFLHAFLKLIFFSVRLFILLPFYRSIHHEVSREQKKSFLLYCTRPDIRYLYNSNNVLGNKEFIFLKIYKIPIHTNLFGLSYLHSKIIYKCIYSSKYLYNICK